MIIAICMTIRIAVVRRSRSARLAELTKLAKPSQARASWPRDMARRQAALKCCWHPATNAIGCALHFLHIWYGWVVRPHTTIIIIIINVIVSMSIVVIVVVVVFLWAAQYQWQIYILIPQKCAAIVFHELDIENNKSNSSNNKDCLSISLRVRSLSTILAIQNEINFGLKCSLIVAQLLHCSAAAASKHWSYFWDFTQAMLMIHKGSRGGRAAKYPIAMLTRSRTKCNLA